MITLFLFLPTASYWIELFLLNLLLKMMMIGEMDIALREAVIVTVIEAVMEGDLLVLIVEKGVVLIMAVGPVHIRERGVALTMAVTVAVAEAPLGGRELALLMGVEALVHIEEKGRVLNLFVTPAAVLITKSEGELTMVFLLLRVQKEEGRKAPKMVMVLAVVLMILGRLALKMDLAPEVLMKKGIPALTMVMEGAQIICLIPGTVPTMAVLKVPCMKDTAGLQTSNYFLEFVIPVYFLQPSVIFIVLIVFIFDNVASHPLQKNDCSL